jgi:dihydrofolate reductase
VIANQTITADGYSAGPNQTEERPFGEDGGDGWGDQLHAWMFDPTGEDQAEVDQINTASAVIMGRNMFGPVRGGWDREWNGWWGDDPPFHAPVFVLTHHGREPQPMAGGTARAARSVLHVTYRVLHDRSPRRDDRSQEPTGATSRSDAGGNSNRRTRSNPEHPTHEERTER